MSERLIENIERRLHEVGKTAAGASREAGLGQSYIRDLKRKGTKPSYENVARLADVLETTTAKLLEGTGSEGDGFTFGKGLPVLGVIEAGAFRDISIQSQDDEHETIEMWKDRRFAHARQYALRVSGDSMNELFPDGGYVVCVDYSESGLSLKPGMVLHVERTVAGHLVETTLKEYQVQGSRRLLVPRSTNPVHKPLEIKGGQDTEIRVHGVVIGEWRPLPVG